MHGFVLVPARGLCSERAPSVALLSCLWEECEALPVALIAA